MTLIATTVLEFYIDDNGCWLWTKAKSSAGYGQLTVEGKRMYWHRYSYSVANGPIPDGLTIDHLCRVKACGNPEHLEAVTQAVNNQRAIPYRIKTHCKNNHPYDEANTYTVKDRRYCRQCNKDTQAVKLVCAGCGESFRRSSMAKHKRRRQHD